MEDTSEIIFGAFVLVIILVLAFLAGREITKFKNRRFTKAWLPLKSIINGNIVTDGSAATSSYLAGTYKGWTVEACSVPDRNKYSGESGHKYNHFDISLKNILGKDDWRVEYKNSLMGFGKPEWHIHSVDDGLEDRLRQSNIVETITAGRGHEVRYTAAQKALVYVEDVTPRLTPEPENFTSTLDIMIRLVKLNEKINS